MRVGNGASEGNANIRLRLGAGNNVYTKTIMLGAQSVSLEYSEVIYPIAG